MARSHTPAAPQTATTYSQKAGMKTLKLKYTGAMQVAVTLCNKWKRGISAGAKGAEAWVSDVAL